MVRHSSKDVKIEEWEEHRVKKSGNSLKGIDDDEKTLNGILNFYDMIKNNEFKF